MTPYSVRKEILIDASINQVWNALTDPESIRSYLFGSEVRSGWTPGSEIVFEGEHEGNKYCDKGKILTLDVEQKLQYTYLSSFSGLEDVPENYSIVTYELAGMDDGETTLNLCQENLPSKEATIHANAAWDHALQALKDLLEK